MGESGFSSHLVNTSSPMNRLLVITFALLGLCHGDKSGAGHAPAASNPVPVSASGAVPPYYSEYDYSNYEPQSQFSGSGPSASLTDRQASIEAVLGAPVVITAFAAALFGGILSPLISEGLSRMGDYQIEWPSFSQRVEKRRKTKKGSSNKARELDNSISWLDLLEGVNTFVSAIRTKRSAAEEPFNADTVSF